MCDYWLIAHQATNPLFGQPQELLLAGDTAPVALSPPPLQEGRTGQNGLLHSLSALLSQRAAAGQGKHVKLLFQLARGVKGVQPRAHTA